MKSQLIAVAFWVFVGAVATVLLDALEAPFWSWILVLVALCTVQRVYCEFLVPRGTRARLLKQVDPAAGPPAGATPADSPTLRHFTELATVQDWDALRTLLSRDFEFVVGRYRFGRKLYIRILKASSRQLPGRTRTDEVVVHPDEPDVLWVRATTSGKPRFGPGFVETSWMRVRLTPDRAQLREIADAGVLQVV